MEYAFRIWRKLQGKGNENMVMKTEVGFSRSVFAVFLPAKRAQYELFNRKRILAHPDDEFPYVGLWPGPAKFIRQERFAGS